MKALTQKEKKARICEAVTRLEARYPEPVCALEYEGDPWRLLVMATLSAQCTDARVNLASRELFSHFPCPAALAAAEQEAVEADIRACGLFRTKAHNIIAASRMLLEEYGSVLPDCMEALLRFPGVGRKVANLLLGDIYRIPGVVTDTHCIRICGRLGMYAEQEKNPAKIEKILAALIPPEKQTDFCHRIVQFGREVCTARAPQCEGCPLRDLCLHAARKGGA